MKRRKEHGSISAAFLIVMAAVSGLILPVVVKHHPKPVGPLAACIANPTSACPRIIPIPPSPPPLSRKTVERILHLASHDVGVDLDLLHAVAVHESGLRSDAISSAGAIGVLQTMPETAAQEGCAHPEDPVCGIYAGARHLARVLNLYHGDVTLALAAYNAGEGAVSKYHGVPPYAETQGYVRAILSDVGE